MDLYTIKARLFPVIVFFSPIFLCGLIYSIDLNSIKEALASLGLLTVATFLFSELGRDRGKNAEAHLWNNWGGAPSMQVLRFKDININSISKLRYHRILMDRCPVERLPDIDLEKEEPEVADSIYRAWSDYLRLRARNPMVQNPILKNELISYGFRRNLWGLKPLAIPSIIVLIFCNFLYWALQTNSINPMNFNVAFIHSTFMFFVFLLMWIFLIQRSWVRLTAFAYAVRLVESIETDNF